MENGIFHGIATAGEVYTYYTSIKGFFTDRSLREEMTWPDSTNDIAIETFSMIWKQIEI